MIAPLAVSFSFLHFQKQLIRKEVKKQLIAGIEKEELVLLTFTEKDSKSLLKWKHSKEFEYKNRMYDVVYQEVKGDIIYYWCWDDDDETLINSNLDNLLQNDAKAKDNKERIVHFFKSLFFSEPQKIAFNTTDVEKLHCLYINNFKSIYLFQSTPPPINFR